MSKFYTMNRYTFQNGDGETETILARTVEEAWQQLDEKYGVDHTFHILE